MYGSTVGNISVLLELEKSAIIIHFRDRSCEQCHDKSVVNGEVIPIIMVSSYKYLGCCIDLDLNNIVVDIRVEAGRRAANLLLQHVRTSVGMLSARSFKKLFK